LVQTVPKDTRSIDNTSIKVQRSAAGGKGDAKNRRSGDLIFSFRVNSHAVLTTVRQKPIDPVELFESPLFRPGNR